MKQVVPVFVSLILWVNTSGFAAGNLDQRLSSEGEANLIRMEAALAGDPDNLRLGNDYRMAVISTGQYDRCLRFFEKLVAAHPNASNAQLSYGFAYVDKIPVAGAITQVILANNALNLFTKALELKPSWIAYYTRGNSYLYWPKVFDRTRLGVADLEEAMKLQKADKRRSYHVRAYISLGDGYWKMDDTARAKLVWKEGLGQFPDNLQLKARLARDGEELKAFIDDALDSTKRVDTNLRELWMDR